MRKNTLAYPLLATTLLFWFSQYTYPALLSNYARDALRASPAMIGAIVSSYGLAQMLLRIPLGFASDRLRRRKPFVTFGTAMTMLAGLGLFFAPTAMWVLMSRAAAGLAAAAWVAFTVLYASYGEPKGGTRALGTLSACMYAAQLAATLLGGWLAGLYGMRGAFLLSAAAGGAGILTSRMVTDVRPQGTPPTVRQMLGVVRDPMLLRSAGLSILMQAITWSTLYGFTPSWAKEVFGAPPSQVALLSVMQLVPNMLLSWLAGAYLIPRLGMRWVVGGGFACMALCCLGIPFTASFGQMLGLQVLSGIGVGCVAPAMLSLSIRDISQEKRGMAMGMYQALYGIGMFLGPVLAGALVQGVANTGVPMIQAYRVNFYAMSAIAIVGTTAAGLLLPRKNPL